MPENMVVPVNAALHLAENNRKRGKIIERIMLTRSHDTQQRGTDGREVSLLIMILKTLKNRDS